MEYPVSEEQIAFYQENGFVQLDSVIDSQELEQLREAIDEVMSIDSELSIGREKGNAYYKVLNQKVNTWRDSAGMARFTLLPRFAEIARKLSGSDGIRLFHDHALWKMPQDSKPTPWHQDLPYWPMNEPGALSMWLTLDDVDERNGCMMFVPGSHQFGKLTGINLVEPQDLFSFVESKDTRKPVVVPLKAGSCTFHNGLTFHYAHANKTDLPRRVLAVIYMPDGTTYLQKDLQRESNHVVTRNIPFKQGDPIRGRFFPILAAKKNAQL